MSALKFLCPLCLVQQQRQDMIQSRARGCFGTDLLTGLLQLECQMDFLLQLHCSYSGLVGTSSAPASPQSWTPLTPPEGQLGGLPPSLAPSLMVLKLQAGGNEVLCHNKCNDASSCQLLPDFVAFRAQSFLCSNANSDQSNCKCHKSSMLQH